MTDYIKRTDAVKIAEKYGLSNGSVLGRHTGLADCIARDISELPAADVAEVVHGRWIWNEEGEIDWEQFYRCSNCGDKEYWESNFCPNCGCRMDGGDDEGVGLREQTLEKNVRVMYTEKPKHVCTKFGNL